jgi:hypothetical protein
MNKTQLETEQKKEYYVTPQMEIVEMDNQTSLLEASPYKGPID